MPRLAHITKLSPIPPGSLLFDRQVVLQKRAGSGELGSFICRAFPNCERTEIGGIGECVRCVNKRKRGNP